MRMQEKISLIPFLAQVPLSGGIKKRVRLDRQVRLYYHIYLTNGLGYSGIKPLIIKQRGHNET